MDALPSSGPVAQKAEPWGPAASANQTNPWGGPAAPSSTSDPWPSFGKDPVLGLLCLPAGWVRGTGQGFVLSPSLHCDGVQAVQFLAVIHTQEALTLVLGDQGTALFLGVLNGFLLG